jgi:hypothetical protein
LDIERKKTEALKEDIELYQKIVNENKLEKKY